MESQDTIKKEDLQKTQMAQINRALAVFLLFFGSVVMAAVFFTETFVGKMTNLTAGLILVLIGVLLFWRTKRSRESS